MKDNGSSKAAAKAAPAPAANAAGNAAGAAEQEMPLAIRGQYIRDLSFEIPRAPESISGLKGAPNVDINIEVATRDLQSDTYEVALSVRFAAPNLRFFCVSAKMLHRKEEVEKKFVLRQVLVAPMSWIELGTVYIYGIVRGAGREGT